MLETFVVITALVTSFADVTNALSQTTLRCDVIVAGGSTAALAAGLTAAKQAPHLTVCLTEPTDWLGGQLTSSGVSAIDFGPLDRQTQYQAHDFAAMMASLGSGNPGNCWVSTKCYQPRRLLEGWLNHTLASLGNLHVLYNTVIKTVATKGRHVDHVTAIQRQPKPGADQWAHSLSQVLPDWYSRTDSSLFQKTEVTLSARSPGHLVVVDGTEYGDVLVLSGAPWRQGVETPTEGSSSLLEGCGQAFTFPFFLVRHGSTVTPGRWPSPGGSFSLSGKPWGQLWSYRRVLAKPGVFHEAKVGEISNQNWGDGNDYKDRYFFLSRSATLAQVSDWQGGVDLRAVKEAELRAYGWFWFYYNQAPDDIRSQLSMSLEDTDTRHGLSKVPYLRESRRSEGLDGFMLTKADMAEASTGQYGVHFPDSVAVGDYQYADVHGTLGCPFPHYVNVNQIKPFYIPFRALTNRGLDNLLVAGKTMAQTFLANAATRMHPVEWTSGLAAGTAAAMMASEGMTSSQLYHQVYRLQAKVKQQQPLDWTSS